MDIYIMTDKDTISYEVAEAAVTDTFKKMLKKSNPYLVPILLPLLEHAKPLFKEFYELGIQHAQNPENLVLDSPALVSGTVFKKGISILNVITAAQRHYLNKLKDPIEPIISPADMIRVAAGELILVDAAKNIIIPKGTTSLALEKGHG